MATANMTAPAADAFSLFAISAQLRNLRSLVIGARPLRVLQLIAQQGLRHVLIGLAIGGGIAAFPGGRVGGGSRRSSGG